VEDVGDVEEVEKTEASTPAVMLTGTTSRDYVLEDGNWEIEIVKRNTPVGISGADFVYGEGACFMSSEIAEAFGFYKCMDQVKTVGGSEPNGNLPSQALQHLPRDAAAANQLAEGLKKSINSGSVPPESPKQPTANAAQTPTVAGVGPDGTSAGEEPVLVPTIPLEGDRLYRATTGCLGLGEIGLVVPTRRYLTLPVNKSAEFDANPGDVLVARAPMDSSRKTGCARSSTTMGT
jgi:hypothetical protein